MSAQKFTAASTVPQSLWTRLASNDRILGLVAVLGVTLLISNVMLMVADTARTLLIFMLLLSAAIWALAYQLVVWRSRVDGLRPSTPRTLTSSASSSLAEIRFQNSNLARYSVAFISITQMALAFGLLLLRYGVLDEAIIAIPLIAVFPFSYIAYVAFQRNVRIERLRRDFQLLDAKWDRALFEQSQGVMNFALHIILAMLATAGGLAIFRYATVEEVSPLLTEQTWWAMRYGFLGAYLYSIQIIYRRYTTYDLLPSVYLYCALTMIGGLIFNYALSVAITGVPTADPKEDSQALPWALSVIAFALGFFPLLAVQWLSRVIQNLMAIRERRSDDLPLSMIDGISQFHETRLRDLGVDNVQNLASIDIPFTLINTTFSAQEIIDWVDQAVLFLHLQTNGIASFRSGTVRTVSDFRQMWRSLYRSRPVPVAPASAQNGNANAASSAANLQNDERKNKALLLQSTPEQLDLLYESTERDPNVHYIMHYWEHVDTLLPNLYGARVNYLLEQAFWTRGADPMNLQQSRAVADQLEAYWNEWITFRDDVGEPGCEDAPVLSNGLAYAGLGFLYRQRYAGEDGVEQTNLDHALRYYLMGYRHNQEINDRILARLRDFPDGICEHLDRIEPECPDLQAVIHDIRFALHCESRQEVPVAEPQVQ